MSRLSSLGQGRTSRGRAVSLGWAAVLIAGAAVVSGPAGIAYAAAPFAVDDSASAMAGTPVIIAVLANDTDASTAAPSIVSGPSQGLAAVNGDKTITYSPGGSAAGTDSFTYTLIPQQQGPSIQTGPIEPRVVISDGPPQTATVTITITPPNHAPVAVDDSASTAPGVPLTVPVPGVLGNDSDPDGHVISAVLDIGPAHGTLTLEANGSFTYNPVAGFTGGDAFTYRASDGLLTSNLATVSIVVGQAPVVQPTEGPPPGAEMFCDGILATIVGTAGDDHLIGTQGTDFIVGLGGNDRIEGVGGKDHICGGDGNDLIAGGEGNDRLVGGPGNDRLYGESGIDRIFGGADNDLMRGGDGDDKVYGGAGVDRGYGDGNDDLVMGDDGDDRVSGGVGLDRIYGGNGTDLLLGGTADDKLYGQAGKDRLFGEDGNDRLEGGPALDLLDGGAGINVLIQ